MGQLPFSRCPQLLESAISNAVASRAATTVASCLGTGLGHFAKYLDFTMVCPREFIAEGLTAAHHAGFSSYMKKNANGSKPTMKKALRGIEFFCQVYDLPIAPCVRRALSKAPTIKRLVSWSDAVQLGAMKKARKVLKRKEVYPATAPVIVRSTSKNSKLTVHWIRLAEAASDGVMIASRWASALRAANDWALFSVGFLGAHRPSEIMVKRAFGTGLTCPVLIWERVKFLSNRRVSICCPHTKVKDDVTIHFHKTGSSLCAVESLTKLKMVCDKLGRGHPTDPVFTEPDGYNPLSYATGVAVIKREVESVLTSRERRSARVSGYSFRRGSATTGYMMNLPIRLIKSITRHSSDAVYNYISRDAAAARTWQLNVAQVSPKLSWFGFVQKDQASRMTIANLDEWEARCPRVNKTWR